MEAYEYRTPTTVERIGAILYQVAGFAFFIPFFWLMKVHSPFWAIPVAFLFFPVARLTGGHLMRQMKIYDYRSDFGFLYRPKPTEIELHMGGSYDYLRLWKKAGSRARMRRLLLADAFATLASAARDVEEGRTPPETRVSAVSYFFADSTPKRFGFKPEPVGIGEKLTFLFSIGDLVPMFWFVDGSFRWPPIMSLKRYATTAGELVQHRAALESLATRLSS